MEPDEVARVFSLMGIMSALMPMLGNPAYRTLFDYYLTDFPRCVLILSSGLAFFNATCNVFLSTQTSQMRLKECDKDHGCGTNEKPIEVYKNIKLNDMNSINSSV